MKTITDFLDDYPTENVLWVTGAQLRELVEKDPDWIGKHATQKNPVGVTTPAYLYDCGLKSLSPYIAFRGTEWEENDSQYVCADLGNNPELKIAQGTFHGKAWFTKSGLTEIDSKNLKIFQVAPNQGATDFSECAKLKVARGTFPCGVDFCMSGVEEIDTHPETGLIITGCATGMAAAFDHCIDLKILRGLYPGKVIANHTDIEEIAFDEKDPGNPAKNLIITKADRDILALSLVECHQLKRIKLRLPGGADIESDSLERIDKLILPETIHRDARIHLIGCNRLSYVPPSLLDNPRVRIADEQRERIRQQIDAEEKARQKLKNQPTPEI